MTDPPPASVAHTTKENGLRELAPIGAWLLLQLIALIVISSGLQPWARFDGALSSCAVQVIGCVQVGFSAILFPTLLGSTKRTAMAVASVPPFLLLAAMMGEVDVTVAIRVSAYVVVWLAALGIIARSMTNDGVHLWSVALISAITFGTTVFAYVSREFGGNKSGAQGLDGPLIGVFSVFDGWTGTWWWPIGILVGAMILFSATRVVDMSSRDVLDAS